MYIILIFMPFYEYFYVNILNSIYMYLFMDMLFLLKHFRKMGDSLNNKLQHM